MSNSTIITPSSSTFTIPPTTTNDEPTSTSTPTTSSASPSSSPTTTSSPSASSSSLVTATSLVTVSPTASDADPTVVTVVTTATNPPTRTDNAAASSEAAASSSSDAAALATSGANSSNGGGLSSGGKIAIAVVVPIVAIALIVAVLIFFWKKRKARKIAEEERRKEVEEYGYNPNNDPTLPAVGSTYGETQSEMLEDNSGYRGWGATSTQRKPSTTMGSSRAPIGMAISDTTSSGGAQHSQPSEGNSGDPLMHGSGNERPSTNDSEPIGALGAAPAAAGQNRELQRGASNASSAYTGHRSEGSGDGDRIGGYAPQNYHDDVTYYNEAQPNHGPYGDGTYGGSGQGQPVIRDVQARRNTRIEKQSHFPQAGNAGIAQNF